MFVRHLVLGVLSLLSVAVVAEEEVSGFPGRAEYPDVAVMEKGELQQKLDQVVVVDTRSSLEFDTLSIKGAVNIPIADKTFEDQIKSLRAKTDKPIVFYCNGRTCMKSYLAVRKCKAVNVSNTFAYDAGMFEWAKTFPQQAVLLGTSPIQPHDIISKDKFDNRLLDPSKFELQAHEMGSKGMILDVRDKYQRGAAGFFPGQEVWASLDDQQRINMLLEQAKKDNKTLFIYDEVGMQVRWLQYKLEKANVKNYYFMDKGAKAYYANMMKDLGISTNHMQ